jgi:hypothetical protein
MWFEVMGQRRHGKGTSVRHYPPISQKPVLHFSYSDHFIFDYIYLNTLGLFRLLIKEHWMMLWYKHLRKIVLTY